MISLENETTFEFILLYNSLGNKEISKPLGLKTTKKQLLNLTPKHWRNNKKNLNTPDIDFPCLKIKSKGRNTYNH